VQPLGDRSQKPVLARNLQPSRSARLGHTQGRLRIGVGCFVQIGFGGHKSFPGSAPSQDRATAYGAARLAATTFVNARQTSVDDFFALGEKFSVGSPMSPSK